jgi:hypothetical protein
MLADGNESIYIIMNNYTELAGTYQFYDGEGHFTISYDEHKNRFVDSTPTENSNSYKH